MKEIYSKMSLFYLIKVPGNLLTLARILRNPQRGRGRTSIEGSDRGHGVNGQLKFVIQGKVSVFGLELLILLRKLQELMILRHAGSEARKLR